ncbi:mitochondrial carrier homolog 2-like isoform X4 [Bolinopsis microptera]|uniref:mitochondrial carrier homolog 2-like isoform X4 n=1 Tax=Bolinopsis microptera TaxID=2820187 RepID=UPI003078CE7A
MVNVDGDIVRMLRSEAGKNPTVRMAGSLAQVLICKPFHTISILLQVGYEPLPPTFRQPSMFFFSGGYYYPNIFKYMKYLADKEGSRLVLYRGLTPRLGGVFITNSVRSEVLAALPVSTSKCPPEQIASEVGRQCAATALAVITSHPLLVVTNRMIVSLIGGEDKYSTVTGAIATIFTEEGLLGFYAGIIPHLLGEVSGKAIEVLIQEIVEKMEINKKLGLPAPAEGKTTLPVSAIHGFLSYPLQLTTTIMTVNNCGLAVSDLPAVQGTQEGWFACIKALWNSGNIKRGSNLMFARKAADQSWHTPPTPAAAFVEAPPNTAEALKISEELLLPLDAPAITEAPSNTAEAWKIADAHLLTIKAPAIAEVPTVDAASVIPVEASPMTAVAWAIADAHVKATDTLVIADVPAVAVEMNSTLTTLNAVVDAAEPVIDAVVDAAPAVVDAVVEAAPAVVDAVVEAAPAVVDAVHAIVDAAEPVIDAVVDAAPAVVDAVVETAPAVVDAVVETAPAVIDAVVDVVCPDGTCGLQAVASE